jgi:small subunit ribosomal protein S7
MPRRNKATKRVIAPDAVYGNTTITSLINSVMTRGKKSTSERIVYDAFDIMEKQLKKPSLEIFDQAIKNIMPVLEVKPRRVGGATYQVPVEVEGGRRLSLAIRWLTNFSRARQGRSMAEKLAAELIDAYQRQGATVKKREDTHRMAEANKAFAHYRW